jgi:Fe-S-cluster-containing dehydrogenase component
MAQAKPNKLHAAIDFENFTYLVHSVNHKVIHKVHIVVFESEGALNNKSFIHCLKMLCETCKTKPCMRACLGFKEV